MNKEQSISVLEQALQGANKAGIFTLQDATVVLTAFNNIKLILDKYVEEIIDKPKELKIIDKSEK